MSIDKPFRVKVLDGEGSWNFVRRRRLTTITNVDKSQSVAIDISVRRAAKRRKYSEFIINGGGSEINPFEDRRPWIFLFHLWGADKVTRVSIITPK